MIVEQFRFIRRFVPHTLTVLGYALSALVPLVSHAADDDAWTVELLSAGTTQVIDLTSSAANRRASSSATSATQTLTVRYEPGNDRLVATQQHDGHLSVTTLPALTSQRDKALLLEAATTATLQIDGTSMIGAISVNGVAAAAPLADERWMLPDVCLNTAVTIAVTFETLATPTSSPLLSLRASPIQQALSDSRLACQNDPNRPPIAHAGDDTTVLVDDTILLDGSGSSDVDGDALTFQWTLVHRPDDSRTVLNDSDTVLPALSIDQPGTYRLSLVVNDGEHDSAPALVTIDTRNSRPLAVTGAPYRTSVDVGVMLDASASYDPDGDVLNYQWRLLSAPSDSQTVLVGASTLAPALTPDVVGDYLLELTVDDGQQRSAPATVVVSTLNSRPTALLDAPVTGVAGETLVLAGTRSYDPEISPLNYHWSLLSAPDGVNTIWVATPDGEPAARIQPSQPGSYLFQLIVDDGTLESVPSTALLIVTAPRKERDDPALQDQDIEDPAFQDDEDRYIEEPTVPGTDKPRVTDQKPVEVPRPVEFDDPPIISVGDDRIVDLNTPVTLDASGSFDPEGNKLRFKWTLQVPKGSRAALDNPSSATPTFTPDQLGDYRLTLAVSDGKLSSDPVQLRIQAVEPQPQLRTAALNSELVGGGNYYFSHSPLDSGRPHLTGDIDVIDLFSGRLTIRHPVLSIPGPGGHDLTLMRFHRQSPGPSQNRLATHSDNSEPLVHLGLDDHGWKMHMGEFQRNSYFSSNLCRQTSGGQTINLPRFITPSGQEKRFFYKEGSGGTYLTDDVWRAQCTNNGDWTISAPDGTRYELEPAPSSFYGSPTPLYRAPLVRRIYDRSNNLITVNYQRISRSGPRGTLRRIGIRNIIGPGGHTITYNYSADTPGQWARIISVTAPNFTGAPVNTRTWNFAFTNVTNSGTSQGFAVSLPRLDTVTLPVTNRVWGYDYTSVGFCYSCMRRVTYPEGGTLEYTFDVGRVATKIADDLTGSTDNNGIRNRWRLRYDDRGTGSSDNTAGDKTTVFWPESKGKTVYRFYDEYEARTSTPKKYWRIGLLKEKSTCTDVDENSTCDSGQNRIEYVSYTWDKRLVVDQPFPQETFPSFFDPQTYAPKLMERMISRDSDIYYSRYREYDEDYGVPKIITEAQGFARRCLTRNYTHSTSATLWVIGQVNNDTYRDNYNIGFNACTGARVSTHSPGQYDLVYGYDNNRRRNSTSLFGSVTTSVYNGNGDVTQITDPDSYTTFYQNYVLGTPTRVDFPNNSASDREIITRGVDSNTGTLRWEKNARGNITYFRYDALNRITGQGLPKSNPGSTVRTNPTYNVVTTYPNPNTIYTRRGSNTTPCVIFSDGFGGCAKDGTRSVQTSLDGFGRKTGEVRDGVFVFTEYDRFGRVASVSYPGDIGGSLGKVKHAYDELGRITSVEHEGTNTGQRSYSYFSGNSIRITDERDHIRTVYYQAFGAPRYDLPELIYAPEGMNTFITRDALGIVREIRQGNLLRSYTYNDLYQLFTVEDPERGKVTYGRDNRGNMTSKSVFGASGIGTYTYDGQSRLQTISYTNNENDYSPPLAYEYDPNGSLLYSTAGTGVAQARWDYVYDSHDKLESETLAVGGHTLRSEYLYDSLDSRTQQRYRYNGTSGTGDTVLYSPNDLGWPTRISGYVNSVNYHPNGTPKRVRYGNNWYTETALYKRQWIQSIVTKKPAGAAELAHGLNLIYTHDNKGNVKSITDQSDSILSPAQSVPMLMYDQVDRLTDAIGPWGLAEMDYDTRGNLIEYRLPNRVTRNMNYNQTTNRLESYTGGNSTYTVHQDARGNLLRDRRKRYGYNHLNQLRISYDRNGGSTLPSIATGPWQYAHAYDANHKRVAKFQKSNGRQRYYMYSLSGQLLMELDTGTNYGPEPKRFFHLGRQLVAERLGNDNTRYIMTDALGSSRVAMSAATNQNKWRENYTPFGDQWRNTASRNFYPVLYSGHVHDGESDLLYMGARFYSPEMGRFYSVDPVGMVGTNIHSFNRYAYANNNPYKFVDPDGKQAMNPRDIIVPIDPFMHGLDSGIGISGPNSRSSSGGRPMPNFGAILGLGLAAAFIAFSESSDDEDAVPESEEIPDEKASEGRQKGDRFTSNDNSLDQLEGIEKAQRKTRQNKRRAQQTLTDGTGNEQIIDDISKSKRRVKNDFKPHNIDLDKLDDF